METVTSADGTTIAYDRVGEGPAVIFVAGALCTRFAWGPGLSELLAPHFTVYNYDRRGRGDSGDTQPYAVAREIEDIAALVDVAGGSAGLYGHSSGAVLALEAAAQLGGAITKLAMYEAPYNDDHANRPAWHRYLTELADCLSLDRRGDAVALFMRYVGTPDAQVEGARLSPGWTGLEAVAPTLAYDHAGVVGPDAAVPVERAARLAVPTLVMYGSGTYPFMRATAETLAKTIPHAELRVLDGQDHNVANEVLAPVLTGFFGR